jgi:hypothetical protein
MHRRIRLWINGLRSQSSVMPPIGHLSLDTKASREQAAPSHVELRDRVTARPSTLCGALRTLVTSRRSLAALQRHLPAQPPPVDSRCRPRGANEVGVRRNTRPDADNSIERSSTPSHARRVSRRMWTTPDDEIRPRTCSVSDCRRLRGERGQHDPTRHKRCDDRGGDGQFRARRHVRFIVAFHRRPRTECDGECSIRVPGPRRSIHREPKTGEDHLYVSRLQERRRRDARDVPVEQLYGDV